MSVCRRGQGSYYAAIKSQDVTLPRAARSLHNTLDLCRPSPVMSTAAQAKIFYQDENIFGQQVQIFST